MRKLLTGNKAIAIGAYQSGVQIATGYPGLPSTEILKSLSKFDNVYCEWSINEKVALDVAIGGALSGKRAMVCMKDLGLNVASESLFQLSKVSLNAGLVLVSCDDAGRMIGDDMNDSRYFAYIADIPLIEPADNQQAMEFIGKAFNISEETGKPVLLRMTAVLTHSTGIVESEISKGSLQQDLQNVGENKWDKKAINKYSDEMNTIILNNKSQRGFIGTGVAMMHAMESFSEDNFFCLGLSNPLPIAKLKEFAAKMENCYVIEETHPILEEKLKENGIACKGSDLFVRGTDPFYFTPSYIDQKINNITEESLIDEHLLPFQLPVNCPGCPHRHLFLAIKEYSNKVAGDSGCYAVNGYPPISKLDAFLCMGAGVSIAEGFNQFLDINQEKESMIAVIGDGVFYHTGFNAILNLYLQQRKGVVIIADNEGIAMTGGQGTPGTCENISLEKKLRNIPIESLLDSFGIENIIVVDPYDLKKMKNTIKQCLDNDKLNVIISRRPCLVKTRFKPIYYCSVNDKCSGCYSCTKIGCMAMKRVFDKADKTNKLEISKELCSGCGLCMEFCPSGAIEKIKIKK
jgi:indolepyruvate ferredoxin oxidoreductase alpha subunit